MGFSQARIAHHQHRLGALQVISLSQRQYLLFVEGRGRLKVEAGQFLEHWEARLFDAATPAIAGAPVAFSFDEAGQISFVRPVSTGGLLCLLPILVENRAEMELLKLLFQLPEGVGGHDSTSSNRL